MKIALYDEDIEEGRMLCKQIRDYYKMCKLVTEVIEFDDHVMLLDTLEEEKFQLVVIAQNGTFSLEIVDRVRSIKPNIKLIWCSDLDFAIRSYEVQVNYFLKKPISEEILGQALKRCIPLL